MPSERMSSLDMNVVLTATASKRPVTWTCPFPNGWPPPQCKCDTPGRAPCGSRQPQCLARVLKTSAAHGHVPPFRAHLAGLSSCSSSVPDTLTNPDLARNLGLPACVICWDKQAACSPLSSTHSQPCCRRQSQCWVRVVKLRPCCRSSSGQGARRLLGRGRA